MVFLQITQQHFQWIANQSHLWIGVSGGRDSSVLLHCMLQYIDPSRITVLHVDHGISTQSSRWACHVQRLSKSYGLKCLILNIEPPTHQIETQSRIRRYQAFFNHVPPEGYLLLGHHLGDQAETILFRLFRGTGPKGLMGMKVKSYREQRWIMRPLLYEPHQSIEQYAQKHRLTWIEDPSNQNLSFKRNAIRHHIIPSIISHFPNAIHHLGICAIHMEALIQNQPKQKHPNPLTILSEPHVSLIHEWIKQHTQITCSYHQIQHIIKEVWHAKKDACPAYRLHHWVIRRYQNKLYLHQNGSFYISHADQSFPWISYPKPFNLPILHHEKKSYLLWNPQGGHLKTIQNPMIRYRKGGEKIKKNGIHSSLKTLFQAAHIPPWLRQTWPLIYDHDLLVCVPHIAIHDDYWLEENGGSITIQTSSESSSKALIPFGLI